MVDAFRNRGLRVGFYHSLLDWHHPDYTVDECHPMRDNPEYAAKDKERDFAAIASICTVRRAAFDAVWQDRHTVVRLFGRSEPALSGQSEDE